jgi:hypothetical protein
MPRRPAVVPSEQLCVRLPADIRGWLDIYLFSEIEGRVPFGAYQAFLSRKIREEREWKQLSLEPYGFPQGFFVVGPPTMLDTLRAALKQRRYA